MERKLKKSKIPPLSTNGKIWYNSRVPDKGTERNPKMKMKYDIFIKDGMARIYQRGELPPYGELPERGVLCVMKEDGDYWEWCNDNGLSEAEDAIRVCRLVKCVRGSFLDDLKERAQNLMNRYREEGRKLGWGELEIDRSGMEYTFRSSANWKDEPIRYTFSQPLRWTEERPPIYSDTVLRIRDLYARLIGMSEAVHELGVDLIFNDDFRIYLAGAFLEWHGEIEE